MSWLKIPSHSLQLLSKLVEKMILSKYIVTQRFVLGSVLQFGHTNSSFVKMTGWQKPRGLALLLKGRLVKREAVGSEGTDGSSVVWSSLCTFWWPQSSQELQDHTAPLTGVAAPPHLVTALLLRPPWKCSLLADTGASSDGGQCDQSQICKTIFWVTSEFPVPCSVLLPWLAGLALLESHSSPNKSACEIAGGAEAAVNVTRT